MPHKIPPGCGLDLHKPLLYNPYFADLQAKRRQRRCTVCQSTVSPEPGALICPVCQFTHTGNTTLPRLYKSLHLRAGRRSGKSLAGAHAVREELAVPRQTWWICGPTFKILHDATMPTLLRLMPPSWVKTWNQDNLELVLINDSIAQFRSLDDPERGRGQGLHGVWLDEAAFIAERAWHVLAPSLAENAGVVLSTTSPGGFDWTYRTFYKKALIDHTPGYWAAKYRTLDNPLFQQSKVLQREVREAQASMPPDVFSAEYEGNDVNFTGAIYGAAMDTQLLVGDAAVRRLLPEWPDISPSRPVLVGLDSGADHPFGAVLIVVTPEGLVVVAEYLERQQAMLTHLAAIQGRFNTARFPQITWAANKNEAQLRLEFGLRGVGVVPTESLHTIGIQRVQSWLHTKQLWFVEATVPKTIDQMRAYRYADNFLSDGQKREREFVFKLQDELPDCLRYACLSYPELPKVQGDNLTERERARWNAFDDRTKLDIERIRAYNDLVLQKDLDEKDEAYPLGDFFGNHTERI